MITGMETIHMLIYLLLDNHTSFDLFAEKFRTFNDKLVNEIKHELEAFVPQPIKDIHLYSDKFF
jgi:hypothetical protein